MKSAIATVAACTVATAAGLAAPVAAASPAPRAEVIRTGGDYLRGTVVLDGALTRHRGNHHRLSYTRDWEGGRGQLTSFWCPTGATITTGWTSSRCVERSRRPVTGGEVRRSATGRSARFAGTLVSTGWVDVPLAVDVSWFRTSEVQTHTYYDGLGEWSETWTWSGRLTGRVDGTPLDPAHEQRGLVGTWEHHEVR